MNRRDFFKTTSLVGAGLIIAPHLAVANNLYPKFQEIYDKVKVNTEMMLKGYDHDRLGDLTFDGNNLYRILYYLQCKRVNDVFVMDYPIQHVPILRDDKLLLLVFSTFTYKTDDVNYIIKKYISDSKLDALGIYTYTNQYVRMSLLQNI